MEKEVPLMVNVVVMMMVQPRVTMVCETGVAYAVVLMVKGVKSP